MQTLRNARWITRLVLVWFALFIGAAVASPLFKADGSQLVCSASGGTKLIAADASPSDATHTDTGMHCPLCLPVAAPPVVAVQPLPPGGLAYALHPLESARLASLIGLPWQARAPPAL